MAATIGHLAVLISAQTAPLTKDMNKAAKIAGDGAKKMKDEVGKHGGNSLWGNFFRGAFAIAAFKKVVNEIRAGVEELKKTGDTGAKAAAEGMEKYDRAIASVSATVAKNLSPALGEAADRFSRTTSAAGDLIDRIRNSSVGRKLGINLDPEKDWALEEKNEKQREAIQKIHLEAAAKRIMDLKALQDKLAAMGPIDWQKQLGLDFHQTAFDKYKETLNKINELVVKEPKKAQVGWDLTRQALDDLITDLDLFADKNDPFARHAKAMEEFNRILFIGNDRIEKRQKLLDGINRTLVDEVAALEKSPLTEFNEQVANFKKLRADNLINDERLNALIGQQVEKLAATQEKLADAKPPEALIKGSAAAYSAINEFQRGKAGGKDAAAIIERAAKEQAERDAEQIRIGREANRHLQKFANIEAMGP